MNQPLVSVILCGYNQAAYLPEAIDSVLNQSYANLELLLIDNGSTDGSRIICERWRDDPRVTLLLYARNASVTSRLNAALKCARGAFISILYADDYYLPRKIETQVEAFASVSAFCGVVYGPGWRCAGHQFWPDASLKQSGDVLHRMFELHDIEGFINPISPLIRRQCFDLDRFDETVFMEGETIFLRFALSWQFHYLPDPLVVMRDHDRNAGKALKRNKTTAILLLAKVLADPRFPPSCVSVAHAFRARLLARCGWLGLRMATDPDWARTCYRECLAVDRWHLRHPKVALGFALACLPRAVTVRVNAVLNRRVPLGMRAYREDYV